MFILLGLALCDMSTNILFIDRIFREVTFKQRNHLKFVYTIQKDTFSIILITNLNINNYEQTRKVQPTEQIELAQNLVPDP